MGTEYDSVKIRALARRISNAAGAVSEVNSGPLRNVTREMPDNFKGSAATALRDSVDEIMTDVKSISSQLSGVSRALYDLAARVDYADQQARAAVNSK